MRLRLTTFTSLRLGLSDHVHVFLQSQFLKSCGGLNAGIDMVCSMAQPAPLTVPQAENILDTFHNTINRPFSLKHL
jgi:hypothetical protein